MASPAPPTPAPTVRSQRAESAVRGVLLHLAAIGRPLKMQSLVVFLGIPTGIIAARFLGPEARGELAAFIAGSFVLSTLIGACSHESLPFLMRDGKDPSRTIGSTVVVQVTLGTLAAAVSLVAPLLPLEIAAVQSLERMQPYFAAACVAYATNHAVSWGVLARSGATAYLKIETVRQLAYLIGVVMLVAVLGFGLQGAIMAFLAALAAQIATANVLLRRTTSDLRWDGAVATSTLQYGRRALPGRIADYAFTGGGDALIMSAAVGPLGVGYYVVARSVSDLILLPSVSTGLMVHAGERSKSGVPLGTRGLTATAGGLTLAGMAVLLLIGPRLIELVYGAAFAESGRLLLVLIAGVPALLVVRVLTALNARSGLPHRNSVAVTVAALAFIVGAIVAGQSFHTTAAVIAFVGAVWLHAALLLILHKLGIPA